MTQPDLFTSEARRQKIRRRVRPTSIQQYADGRERFTGRKADVLRWLAHHYNLFQYTPTSAELWSWSKWNSGILTGFSDWTALKLYIRRGISDLQTAGVVERVPQGDRKCAVTGRTCCTWRVIPIGRTR